MTLYPEEALDEEIDNGTMVESRKALEKAVVGERIVKVEDNGRKIHLSNGMTVTLREVSDCCAYTDLESFLLHPERVQHAISGVGTTDGYTTWHIFADAGDIMEMKVGWSAGNPFYYGYGFDIVVEDLNTGDFVLDAKGETFDD